MINLQSVNRFSWTPEGVDGFEVREVLVGPSSGGVSGFEVVLCTSSKSVTRATLNALHRARVGKRIADVAIACETPSGVWVFGPDAGRAPMQLSPAPATQQLQAALNEPDSVASYRRLVGIQDAQQTTEMPGVRNRGLFASYHLRENVPGRKDWEVYQNKADALLPLRHRDLIAHLGYHLSDGPSHTLVLNTAGSTPRAVALLLEQDEQFEATANRFQRSPVAVGLSAAGQQGVPWLILVRSDQIRLYPARDNVGVGQKGQVETYLELDLASLAPGHAGLLPLVFSAESLAEGGVIDELLEQSARFATELGVRLRARVYESFVPNIATEVAYAVRKSGRTLDSEGLTFAYQVTLNILFRLLFQAYGEDRGLLPAGRNEAYDANSLKTLGKRLLDQPDLELGQASSIWRDLRQVWDSIDKGNKQFELPAYNGGLFASDPERHPEGAFIDQLIISDSVMGPALAALLIDDTEDGVQGLVDFRSLSVREFGTIYEGLLESSLSVADQDLVLDASGAFVPAGNTDIVTVRTGEPFFHNSSGERKATGSYFTPSFIVDHLVERTIDPTLDRHLERIRQLVEEGKTHDAAKDFFDYRVADLAMGSGHFLVAAIDRIEAKMRDFLADPEISMPGVTSELERLAQAAKEALGRDEAAFEDIEQATLLRRQIARRCVYGLDINPLAVELSRLALWIHTFVPGLPMSTLDHNLVYANSLTGTARSDEALEVLDGSAVHGAPRLFDSGLSDFFDRASELLVEFADASEADKAEVLSNKERLEEVKAILAEPKALNDAAVAIRVGGVSTSGPIEQESLRSWVEEPGVSDLIGKLRPAHFSYLFPEVFTRRNPGFDALIGNPPWEELTVEEHKFWRRKLQTGARKLTKNDFIANRNEFPHLAVELHSLRETVAFARKAIASAGFPGFEVGDPDLYLPFAWRNWSLLRAGGRFGLVLPQSILSAKSSVAWRRAVFSRASVEISLFRNSSNWVFEANPGLRFVTVTAQEGREPSFNVGGEFNSPETFAKMADTSLRSEPIDFSLVEQNDPEACIPLVKSPAQFDLWRHLISFPALGDGRAGQRPDFRCAPVTQIHASIDGRDKGIFTGNPDDSPVWNHLNVGDLYFDPAPGAFNHADWDQELGRQLQVRARTWRRASSPFSIQTPQWNLDDATHPVLHPRICFRDVVHASNPRKSWFCLAPARTMWTNKAPYLVFDNEDHTLQAYVLGVLSSSVVDWFAHLRVTLNLNFFILYSLPVPLFIGSENQKAIGDLAASLAIDQAYDYGKWSEVWHPVDLSSRKAARLELEARVAMEFGLTTKFLREVFSSEGGERPTLGEVENALTAILGESLRKRNP